MQLFYGVLGIMVAGVLFGLLLIGSRNPKPARWKTDFLVANIYVPAIIATGVLSVAMVFQYWLGFELANLRWEEFALAAATVCIGVVALKSLKIKQRLVQYEEQEKAAGAVVLNLARPDEKPEPPVIDRRAA